MYLFHCGRKKIYYAHKQFLLLPENTEKLLKSETGITSWVVTGFSIFSFAINIICDISLHFYL